jgi:threonine/homoserine/homoserine lactone efflux protein
MTHEWQIVLSVALIHLALVVSPGANFVMVAQNALRSRRDGLLTASGVASVAMLWASLAALGLGVLLSQLGGLVLVMKWLGAAYLVYVGVRTWLRANRASSGNVTTRDGHPYLAGALTNLTNPQSVLFFGAMFSAAIPLEASLGVRVACVVAAGFNALAWYSLVALGLSNPIIRARYSRLKSWIDRASGALMVFFGVRLALSR